MNRPIEFEVKIRRKDGTDSWIEVLTLDDLLNRNGCLYNQNIQEIVYKRQFTGLLDKNGKKVFEGDIVRWDDESDGRYWRVCEIFWDKSHYALRGYTFYSKTPQEKTKVDFKFGQFIYEYDNVLEVIGNVWETPELLSNTKQRG